MPSDIDRLDEAELCHDEEPERAAALLRDIDVAQLPPERWPGHAFLLNHVLGEKLQRWSEALQRQRALLRQAQPAPSAALWRQGATAALLAGDAELERVMTESLAEAAGASLPRAHELVRLCAAMYRATGEAGATAAAGLRAALAPLHSNDWQADTPLDAAVAACTNNIANGLLERPVADLRLAALRSALADAAEQSHRFWLRAGTWVNHERALYLRAMVCNVLDQAQWARAHAQAGLALLDEHDGDAAQTIDRAFLELEQWHACMVLRRHADAAEALARATALAEGFDDEFWRASFERRRIGLQRQHLGPEG
ncbi:MAG: hypothetical protein OEY03_16245 [Rhizobacter sp.]|nr:hypothetical protein [Rhizobacter sp.]